MTNEESYLARSSNMQVERLVLSRTPSVTAELALLITIAKVDLSADASNNLQELLEQPLQWQYLAALAELHGLEPLLFHHLSKFPDAGLAQIMQKLREKCRIIALRNLLLSASLCKISAHLTSLEIEHIAYKGPLLAEIYGGNGTLRIYRDLDLLVPHSKLVAVRDALSAIGFKDRYGLTASQQAASFFCGFEHSFASAAGIDVDVHWRVVQEFKAPAFDMPGVWSRKISATLLDQQIPALSQEDLFMALCLHAGHHGWTCLSHLCDVAQVLKSQSLFDWGIILSHLGDSNTLRIVAVTMSLLNRHWECQIPDRIARLIAADAQVPVLIDRIEHEIWPSLAPELTTSNFKWLLIRSAGERLPDRLRLIAGSIFVPASEDFALADFSPTLSFLYSGLRAIRLTNRYVRSSCNRDGHRVRKPIAFASSRSELTEDAVEGSGINKIERESRFKLR